MSHLGGNISSFELLIIEPLIDRSGDSLPDTTTACHVAITAQCTTVAMIRVGELALSGPFPGPVEAGILDRLLWVETFGR